MGASANWEHCEEGCDPLSSLRSGEGLSVEDRRASASLKNKALSIGRRWRESSEIPENVVEPSRNLIVDRAVKNIVFLCLFVFAKYFLAFVMCT
jgi:hypothetical protein